MMMGVGQVVTLRLPAIKLREVNLAIENSAWGLLEQSFILHMTTLRLRSGKNWKIAWRNKMRLDVFAAVIFIFLWIKLGPCRGLPLDLNRKAGLGDRARSSSRSY